MRVDIMRQVTFSISMSIQIVWRSSETLRVYDSDVKWNAGEFVKGVYFYGLQAGEFVETKKLVLLR